MGRVQGRGAGQPAMIGRDRVFFFFFYCLCVFGVHAAWLDLRSAITVRAGKGSRNQGLEQPLGGGLSRGTFVRSMAMKSCSLFFVCACMAPHEAVFKLASDFWQPC